jgi:hypothetical protein
LRQHERRRPPAGLKAGWIALALASAAALAQPGPAADPTACAEIQSREARLECYDKAFTAPVEGSSAPAEARDSAAAAPAAAGPAATAEQAHGEALVPAAETGAGLETQVERVESDGVARDAKTPDSGPRSVLVEQLEYDLSGLAVMRTDDGTIFKQVSTQRARLPDVPFVARLRPASMGTYFLETDASRSRIRVRVRD